MSGTSAARLSRLLAMVPWLYANDGVTIEEAARHFGVSAAQMEKDLWLLILCGLPGYGPDQLIDIQFWGADARIHVIDPQTLERPLRLSGDESAALLVALRLLAQIPGGHDRAALLSAMDKLQEAVGDRHADEVVLVDSGTREEVVRAIDDALRRGLVLRIRYSGSARDVITDREVEPIAVRTIDGRSYLEAWCHLAGAIRTFRVDRMVSAELTEAVIAADRLAGDDPDGGDPPSVGTGDEIWSTAREAVALEAELEVQASARWALDVYPMEVVSEGPDGSVIARISVRDPDWLVRMVLGMRGLVVVQGPADLRNAVMHAAQAALRGYYEPTSPNPEGT